MTTPPRPPTLREALEECVSRLVEQTMQDVPKRVLLDTISVARAALAAEESWLSCAKCGEWLGDGRTIMWEPATGRCYCIGHEPHLPPAPSPKEESK